MKIIKESFNILDGKKSRAGDLSSGTAKPQRG